MSPENPPAPKPVRHYSKTDLRRGTVPPSEAARARREVAAEEQAALFGETPPAIENPEARPK